MNAREKFLSSMRMKNNDYSGVGIPRVEFGYWAGTIRRWFKEGLSVVAPVPDNYSDGIAIMANKNIYGEMEKAGDVNVQPVFGLDQHLTKFPVDYSPMFKKEVISKDDINITYKNKKSISEFSDNGWIW